MFLLSCVLTIAIGAMLIALLFSLDPKRNLGDRIFYFTMFLVLLVVVLLMFDAMGVLKLW